MRKLVFSGLAFVALAVGPAVAADMPVKAPAYNAPAPVLAWTGFYGGINGGYGWDAHNGDIVTQEFLNSTLFFTQQWPSRDMDGGFFGGQLGYNWQWNQWVFGIEGDLQWSGIKGDSVATRPYTLGVTTHTLSSSGDLDWFGTVRARSGWLLNPALLVYGTGGFAFGNAEYSFAWRDTFGFRAAGSSDKSSGWTLGGGFEWMFAPRWSVKAEYQYLDFGRTSFAGREFFGGAAAPTAFSISTDAHATFHTVRIGINYFFGDYGKAPVVAKY